MKVDAEIGVKVITVVYHIVKREEVLEAFLNHIEVIQMEVKICEKGVQATKMDTITKPIISTSKTYLTTLPKKI